MANEVATVALGRFKIRICDNPVLMPASPFDRLRLSKDSGFYHLVDQVAADLAPTLKLPGGHGFGLGTRWALRR
jgi:hypothetical protein